VTSKAVTSNAGIFFRLPWPAIALPNIRCALNESDEPSETKSFEGGMGKHRAREIGDMKEREMGRGRGEAEAESPSSIHVLWIFLFNY
jgi:hypothetical protein